MDAGSVEERGVSRGRSAAAGGWSAAMLRVLLSRRGLAALLLAATFAHAASSLAGMPIHRCGLRAATGLPCPGCGLTRGSAYLASGRLDAMWRTHPFTPYFAVLGLVLAGAALLPEPWRARWARGWVAIEARTRLHAGFLIGFAVFGVARLLWSAAGFR